MKKKVAVRTLSWLLVLLLVAPPWAFAQDQGDSQKFTQAELDQMLAPIALYPDSLLAQILMASTYPLEVVMADRWVKENKGLQGDQLNAELDRQDWDPSVKALVPFPRVLDMMSEKLGWTEKLGDAFLDQQDAVMDTIQKLREKAQEAGNLKTGKEQKVITEGNTIVIEPVNPDVIYVPVYNPAIVYGPWWYPDYPPFWYYPPGYAVAGIIFSFPFFCVVGPSWLFAWGHWDWHHHRVYANVDRHININRIHINRTDVRTDTWRHDVGHRRGVLYRNEETRQRYRQTSRGPVEDRRVFRGFSTNGKTSNELRSGQQTIQPEGKTSGGVKSGQQTSPQYKGPSASGQRKIESGRDRTVFSGIDRGSVVRSQSNRGSQSRGSVTSKGGVGGGVGGGGQGGDRGSQGDGRGSQGSDRGSQGSDRGSQGSDRGSQGSDRGSQGSDRGSQGSDRGSQGSDRGSRH